jgi:ferredoxin
MEKLLRSKDRKVANLASKSGKTPAISNTFGLPAGNSFSCISMTKVCGKICYANKVEKMYKNVRIVLMHNYTLLKDASFGEMVTLLDDMIYQFEVECDKREAEKVFRIHWDGDFFSNLYADAWARVIHLHPNVQFWTYTRNWSAAVRLDSWRFANLSLYFSVDDENESYARCNAKSFPNIRLAYLANTFSEAQQKVRSITGGTAAKCPEQTKQIPLISPEGGACIKCGLCIKGKADIAFSITKK